MIFRDSLGSCQGAARPYNAAFPKPGARLNLALDRRWDPFTGKTWIR
jgi:hypothetical protein